MTDDRFETVYVDEDGSELSLSPGGLLMATDYNDDTAEHAIVRVPAHVAAALRLAIDLGPDAVLRDVAPLLQQCDREDMSPEVSHRYLTTREIRVKLGLPSKCGNTRSELGGARCSLDEHSGDSWHVDPERGIRWRNYGDGFDVRGWTPDEMEVGPAADLDADYTGRKAAEITAALDKVGAPNYLDADNARNVLSSHGVGIVATGDAWNRAVKVRQARVPDVRS